MEERALTLAEQAIEAEPGWVQRSGPCRGIRRAGALVARSLNRRRLPGPLAHRGSPPARRNFGSRILDQMAQRERALAAGEREKAISTNTTKQQINPGSELGCRDAAGGRSLSRLSRVLTDS